MTSMRYNRLRVHAEHVAPSRSILEEANRKIGFDTVRDRVFIQVYPRPAVVDASFIRDKARAVRSGRWYEFHTEI